MKIGVGTVSIINIAHKLAFNVINLNIGIKDYCNAILGVYCFTGCETISAMVGKGKLKALKVLSEKKLFVDAFNKLGQSWELDDELAADIEKFVCRLYGHKVSSLNELRYKLYCSKNGKIESEMLPPSENALKQHLLVRANYQVVIWRRALEYGGPKVTFSQHDFYKVNQIGYLPYFYKAEKVLFSKFCCSIFISRTGFVF